MLFSTTHLRSCCLSFFVLAVLFTLTNLFTSTHVHQLTTDRSTTIPPSSSSPAALLSLNPYDVRRRRYHCYERTFHPRFPRQRLTIRTTELEQPNRTDSAMHSIPYDYELWQSAPVMPRLVSQCEHRLMMQLLKRFDQLARKYSLEYMMVDGTLLGSWRHHDLIPWDDDIDLLMSVKLKDRLNRAIELESSSSPYVIEFHRRWDAPKAFEYYKFYFSISPRFSEYPWRYPFVDLIFYHENETHLWHENMQDTSSFDKRSIFPLSYRPLGSLWLPAPRSPHDYFLTINWTTYAADCFNGPWSHKFERTKEFDYGLDFKSLVLCEELKEFYPFVQRHSSTDKQERLIINGTVKQLIRLIEE